MGKMYECGCAWGGDGPFPDKCPEHGKPEVKDRNLAALIANGVKIGKTIKPPRPKFRIPPEWEAS